MQLQVLQRYRITRLKAQLFKFMQFLEPDGDMAKLEPKYRQLYKDLSALYNNVEDIILT